MAEAARNTPHYVSDCLAERYPYDASRGFAGMRQKDAGRVHNGYDTAGASNLMRSLSDPAVSAEEKAKAARHLYSRSASQEAKIELLRQDIVPLLVATVSSNSNLLLVHQCLLLLRSLAAVPQGCVALVHQGAVLPTLRSLHLAGGEDARRCHDAAAHVLYQISSNLSGMRCLVGAPQETMMTADDVQADGDGSELLSADEFIHEVVQVLSLGAGVSSKATAYLVQVLANLTRLPQGVDAFLAVPEAVSALAALVEQALTDTADGVPEQAATLDEATFELAWNVGLSSAGGPALEVCQLPRLLFAAFARIGADVQACPISVQRQLTGALSAVHQLTSVKTDSTQPLLSSSSSPTAAAAEAPETRIEALMQYLRRWNAVVETEYTQTGQPVPNGVLAILKNTVQCIRLASEVKAVRDATHATLAAMERSGTTEAFFFRRQLYVHTRWEAEYDASVDV